jgi:hypothetical protein
MLGRDARLRNRRSDLRQFLERFCPPPDRPRAKFFAQALWGILNSGSLVVARWLRWLAGADRCRHRFWRHKRLLDQLRSTRWDHGPVQADYQRAWGARVQPDTPLVLDLCDLAKPRARTLEHLALVRDGSDGGRLVYGYWCVELYAAWGKGRITPLLLHPYSVEDPRVKGENAVILQCVEQVYAATGGRGVLVMDAGGDRDALLIPWVDAEHLFVVRLRGDRHLRLDDGTRVEARLLADTLLARAAKKHPGRRIVWRRVYLPERPDRPLHLVAKTIEGGDRALILLTTLTVEDREAARRALSYYRRRWRCEEAARFLKTELGLERFAVRTYESLPRLMFLAALAMGFLTWLQLRMPSLHTWLCDKSPGRRTVKFAYYRILQWVQEQVLPANVLPAPP